MRRTKAVDIDGSTYMVRELTPNEIDALFDVQHQRTTVDDMLDAHHLDTVLLGSMLGVDPSRCAEILGDKTPSTYQPLITAAQEVNHDFFAMARSRKEHAGNLAAINKILAEQLSGSYSAKRSDGSPHLDTPMPPTTV